MNKKLIPAIVILALLGVGAYLVNAKKSTPGSPQTQSQTMNEASEFAEAMKSGQPTTCTLTKGTDITEYVIKGKKMRANMTTTMEGKATRSHMINDEQSLYMWVDGQAQGSKMSLLIPSPSPLTPTPSEPTTVPKFESEADYKNLQDLGYTINCQSGSVDEAVFTPPTDINFIDPTEMMKQMTAPGTAGQIDYKKLQEQYAGQY